MVGLLEKYAVRDAQNAALKLLYAEQLGAAGDFDAAERIYRNMAESTATPEVYRGLFKLYAAAPPHFDRLLKVLDENLGKAAGREDGNETGRCRPPPGPAPCSSCCARMPPWSAG